MTPSHSHARCLLLAMLLSASVATAADNDPKAAARDMATLGVTLYDGGDYAGARDLFHRAFLVIPAPSILVREARSLAKLGQLTEAAELYAHTAAWPLDENSPEAYRVAVAQATQELPTVRTRIPKLRIITRVGTAFEVRIDGASVDPARFGTTMEIDPGNHRIELHAGSQVIATQSLTLAEADVRTIELDPRGEGPHVQMISRDETSHPWRSVGWASLGVGAAGLLVGVTTGVLATSKKSSLEDACPTHVCPASSSDDVDSLHSLRTASTVGYIVGFAGVAAGATLLITIPARYLDSTVTAFLGPSRVGVSGSF